MKKVIKKSAIELKDEIMELIVKEINNSERAIEDLEAKGLERDVEDTEMFKFALEEILAKINNINAYKYDNGSQIITAEDY